MLLGTDACVVMTTVDSEATAGSLAKKLVDARLAACVQVQQITSFYTWQGESRRDPEWLLVIKTSTSRFAEVQAAILADHPYDTPEVIRLPVDDGSPAYLAWIEAQTS
ncbi:MAG: divalent-cation tolerance protein CutA [Pseudomonadota bacterium]